MASQSDGVDAQLHDLWRELALGGPQHVDSLFTSRRSYAIGYVDALLAAGLLSEIEREAWTGRFSRCPGHDADSGQVWCSYCGAFGAEAEGPNGG